MNCLGFEFITCPVPVWFIKNRKMADDSPNGFHGILPTVSCFVFVCMFVCVGAKIIWGQLTNPLFYHKHNSLLIYFYTLLNSAFVISLIFLSFKTTAATTTKHGLNKAEPSFILEWLHMLGVHSVTTEMRKVDLLISEGRCKPN